LLKRLEQPLGEQDFTIAEWCAKRRISKAEFYRMKKEGRGPRVTENGALRRISPESDRAWEARWGTSG
jgi:hypothetical protein